MTTNTGGPALPGLHPSAECRYNDPGISMRDYFAAKAMQGVVASSSEALNQEICAAWSYEMADAMIEARTE